MIQFHFWPPSRKWHHLQLVLSCWGDQYGRLDTLNIKIHQLFQILQTEQDVARSLFPILATRELVTPLANNPIISEKLIQSFRHLKHLNLYTGDSFINSSGIIFQFKFWPPGRHSRHLPMILSCREDLYGHLDTLNVKIS